MYEISKTFTFSAAHALTHLPAEHKCHRLHGHNYTVTVLLQSLELDDRGFIVDYAELSSIKSWIDEHWDHRNLNDWFSPSIPTTAENIARVLYRQFKPIFWQLQRVTVQETENTSAGYWE